MNLNNQINKEFSYFSQNAGRDIIGRLKSIDGENAHMEDGTVIPLEFFSDVAVSTDDNGNGSITNSNMIIDPNDEEGQQPSRRRQQNTAQAPGGIPMNFDENGMPLLPAGGDEDFDGGMIVSPEVYSNKGSGIKKSSVKDPNLRSLLDKATKKTKRVSISLDIEIVDTKLYKLLAENFGDESKEDILNYIIDNLDSSQLKDMLRDRLFSIYNPSSKGKKEENNKENGSKQT